MELIHCRRTLFHLWFSWSQSQLCHQLRFACVFSSLISVSPVTCHVWSGRVFHLALSRLPDCNIRLTCSSLHTCQPSAHLVNSVSAPGFHPLIARLLSHSGWQYPSLVCSNIINSLVLFVLWRAIFLCLHDHHLPVSLPSSFLSDLSCQAATLIPSLAPPVSPLS